VSRLTRRPPTVRLGRAGDSTGMRNAPPGNLPHESMVGRRERVCIVPQTGMAAAPREGDDGEAVHPGEETAFAPTARPYRFFCRPKC